MVSWSTAGKLAGYNATTKTYDPNTFSFASPGSVNLNGMTRLQYGIAGLPSSANRLSATAPISLGSGDFTANPGKKLCAAMFLARATSFPEGYVPTPTEILALGSSKVAVFRASQFVTSPGVFTFAMPGPLAQQLIADAKYWVLVLPTALSDTNSPWSLANDKPMAGTNSNTLGRALSVWTNRTPKAPVITSPTPGAIVAPGTTVNFAYVPDDPDKTVPSDTARLNQDLAGVQVEYAPIATPENPNPLWRALTFCNSQGDTKDGWFIRGMSDWYQGDGRDLMVDNLGFPILCGANEPLPLQGVLSGGEWQIRCRTFDYGHPYPGMENPLGDPTGSYNAYTYPTTNSSPWSAPVRISVPSQVPPPIPLYPTSGLAVVENAPVRMSWQYRNSARPAYPQAARTVQIRKTGDETWSTVAAGASTTHFIDLPPITTSPPYVPAMEYMIDPGFEDGTLGSWQVDPAIYPDAPATPVVNVTASASQTGSHSGTRHIRCNYFQSYFMGSPASVDASFSRRVSLTEPTHLSFTFSGWVGVGSNTYGVFFQAVWQDAGGNQVGGLVVNDQILRPVGGWGSSLWRRIGFGPVARPVGATHLYLAVIGLGDTVSGSIRLDDVSLIGENPNATDSFTFSATKEYEWRVKTQDTDNEASTYSVPAQFWVVPAPESGAVRPEPSETIDGATLGCGGHRVEVYRRGGKVRVGELKNLSYVEWNRVRDDISTAKIVVSGWDVDCGNLLSQLESWAYEIVIFRDNGFSIDRVWEGPITLPTWEVDKVTILAKDVMAYPYRRIIKQIMNDAGVGDSVVSRAARILQNVMAPDDPNVLSYLSVLSEPDDVKQYRNTPAYSRTAFEEIDDMAANQGLDYTAVGRAILLWGTKHRIGTLPEFKDENFGSPPIVSEYGMNMANVYAISDGNGVHGEATRLDVSGNDEKYGLVEMLSSSWASDSPEDSGTYTQAGLEKVIQSFKDSSERSIADRYRPGAPVVVRIPDNTSLSPDTALSIQQLVPGVAIPLHSTATLREVRAVQKLDSVKVVETDGRETISITLSQFNREDAEIPEEGE